MSTTEISEGMEGAAIIAEMDAVEIKVTVRPDQELRAERAMEVNEDTADIRILYFFDTPNLDLFEAGLALRARLVKGDRDDTTVKFRRAETKDVSNAWRRLEGFKVEADWVGDRIVYSASLTNPQPGHEIKDVAHGKRGIGKLFTKEQEHFLAEFYTGSVDFDRLRVMGPIRVLRWKLRHKGFPHELTVEEWRLPDGDDLVEVSIKVPTDEAAQARKEFDEHLQSMSLDPRGAQETKTRTALEYFARAGAKIES
jgi:hypothetical protein